MNNEKKIILVELPKNIGFGAGNNVGIKVSSGKFIFFHNPDLEVYEDSLQKMIDFLEKNKDIGILAPKIVYDNGDIQPSCRRHMSFFDMVIKRTFLRRLPFFNRKLKYYLMNEFDHNEIQDVEIVTGAAIMISRKIFDKISGFDKRYFLFMEDFDLCLKVHEAEYRVVYYPNAVVQHYHTRLSNNGSFFKIIFNKVFWFHVSSAIKYRIKWRHYKPKI